MRAKNVDITKLERMPYLSTANAAVVTGLPVSMLRKAINEGKIPVVKSGRCSYVDMKALPEALKKLGNDVQ